MTVDERCMMAFLTQKVLELGAGSLSPVDMQALEHIANELDDCGVNAEMVQSLG